MIKKTIKIQGDNSSFLSVSLIDILTQIENGEKYSWNILWIEAIGNPENTNMLEFEEKVNNSINGFLLSWNDLVKLSKSLFQVINIVLLGDENKNNLKRYSDDEEMYLNCTFYIELIDSSHWEIKCKDIKSVEQLTKLPGAQIIDL